MYQVLTEQQQKLQEKINMAAAEISRNGPEIWYQQMENLVYQIKVKLENKGAAGNKHNARGGGGGNLVMNEASSPLNEIKDLHVEMEKHVQQVVEARMLSYRSLMGQQQKLNLTSNVFFKLPEPTKLQMTRTRQLLESLLQQKLYLAQLVATTVELQPLPPFWRLISDIVIGGGKFNSGDHSTSSSQHTKMAGAGDQQMTPKDDTTPMKTLDQQMTEWLAELRTSDPPILPPVLQLYIFYYVRIR